MSDNNGYPNVVVESIIRRHFNSEYEPHKAVTRTHEIGLIVLRIPCCGKPSQIYANRAMVAVKKQYSFKKVRVVYTWKYVIHNDVSMSIHWFLCD